MEELETPQCPGLGYGFQDSVEVAVHQVLTGITPSFLKSWIQHFTLQGRLRSITVHRELFSFHSMHQTTMEIRQGLMCQSCGMPFSEPEDYGTEKDGSKSQDYCFHCYQEGKFLDEGITLAGKIEKNVKFGVQMGMTEEMAQDMCRKILPALKRWKKE